MFAKTYMMIIVGSLISVISVLISLRFSIILEHYIKKMFEKLLTIRTLIGFMVFTATCMSYILRVSFNIAIVTMTDVDTDDNTTTDSSSCDNHSDTFR